MDGIGSMTDGDRCTMVRLQHFFQPKRVDLVCKEGMGWYIVIFFYIEGIVFTSFDSLLFNSLLDYISLQCSLIMPLKGVRLPYQDKIPLSWGMITR